MLEGMDQPFSLLKVLHHQEELSFPNKTGICSLRSMQRNQGLGRQA